MLNSQWSAVSSQWWEKIVFSKLLWTVVCGLWSISSFSATPVYLKTIEKKPTDIYVNTSNDIFLLQKGMLERYNADGTFFQNYGSIYINDNTEIISVNSFKTILFSPDYGKIIQLDNRLRELDVIDSYNLGTYIITCVGISYDNNYLWLWDASTQRLIKLDKDQRPIFESNNMSLWAGTTLEPKQIVESGINLYILDNKKGIFVFDNQGNFIKQIPIPDIEVMEIIEGQIIYYKANCIYAYNTLTFSEIKYTQTPNLENIQIGKTVLCGVNKDSFVEIWKF